MSVEGISRSTIARVEHLSRPTIDRWLDRACETAQPFNDQMIQNVPLQELQTDEIQTRALDTACPTWIFTTLEVWSRLWVSTVVGRRSRHHADQLLQDTMSWGNLAELCRMTTDGYAAYAGVIRHIVGKNCVYAQVVKTWRNNRVALHSCGPRIWCMAPPARSSVLDFRSLAACGTVMQPVHKHKEYL